MLLVTVYVSVFVPGMRDVIIERENCQASYTKPTLLLTRIKLLNQRRGSWYSSYFLIHVFVNQLPIHHFTINCIVYNINPFNINLCCCSEKCLL